MVTIEIEEEGYKNEQIFGDYRRIRKRNIRFQRESYNRSRSFGGR